MRLVFINISYSLVVLFNRGRKGKKGQQQQRSKGKESPTESPTSPSNGFDFATRVRVHYLFICSMTIAFCHRKVKVVLQKMM